MKKIAKNNLSLNLKITLTRERVRTLAKIAEKATRRAICSVAVVSTAVRVQPGRMAWIKTKFPHNHASAQTQLGSNGESRLHDIKVADSGFDPPTFEL